MSSNSFEAARRRAAAARSAARRAAEARRSMYGDYEQEGGTISAETKEWKLNNPGKVAIARNYGSAKRARARVYAGNALKTAGGLTKDDLIKNKYGRIVSKKASEAAKARYDANTSVRLALAAGRRLNTRLGKGRVVGSKNKPVRKSLRTVTIKHKTGNTTTRAETLADHRRLVRKARVAGAKKAGSKRKGVKLGPRRIGLSQMGLGRRYFN